MPSLKRSYTSPESLSDYFVPAVEFFLKMFQTTIFKIIPMITQKTKLQPCHVSSSKTVLSAEFKNFSRIDDNENVCFSRKTCKMRSDSNKVFIGQNHRNKNKNYRS